MSMQVLTVLQFAVITCVYFIMTLILPAILLYKKIAHLKFSARFMIYQTLGNFYMMNIVFALQLLHISNRYTLTLCTIVLFFIVYIKIYKKKPKKMLVQFVQDLRRLAEGQYGLRLFLARIFGRIFRLIKRGIGAAVKNIIRNIPDILLALGLTAAILYIYGRNAWLRFGYCASDIPVHNYWINYLSKGELFVAGVYPFGFHCIIYYLHMVFGLDTYVLLRLFWLLQTMIIHFMLLAFIRLCAKAKYTPYIGVFVFTFSSVFARNTYMRYISSLPQEFGMIFILPSAYFLLAFFEKKAQELREKAEAPDGGASEEENSESVLTLDDLETNPGAEEISVSIAEAGGSETVGVISIDDVAAQEEGAAHSDGKKEKILIRIKTFFADTKHEFQSESSWYLAVFAMNFAMTLASHFYDTMVAGLFCIGIAVGYGFRLFRKHYFGRVLTAGILSIVIAALPMVLAYIGGTPLQGSLGWGMNIINGEDDGGDSGEITPEHFKGITTIWGTELIIDGKIVSENAVITGGRVVSQGDIIVNGREIKGSQMLFDGSISVDGEVVYEGTFISIGNHLPEDDSGELEITEEIFEQQQIEPDRLTTIVQGIKGGVQNAIRSIKYVVETYLIAVENTWLYRSVPFSIIFLAVLSVLYFVLRQTDYAAKLLSTSAFMGCMMLLFISSYVSILPELMDVTRASIYCAYSIITVWCLCIDGVLQMVLGWFKKKWLMHIVSFVLALAISFGIIEYGFVKEIQFTGSAFQTNEAVTCLTNIIRENNDGTWTICSANDELRMGEDHGYHYEVHTFLREMEHTGGGSSITIPTQKVYFFIEKIPIDYAVAYEGSGQSVSEEGAANALPPGRGISMYQGRNRWIEMSRMYYWAKEFQKLYPNEMKVYYETDNFICYYVEQNTYSLYNFSINYDYNLREYGTDQEG